jgi:hypothetical protein
MLKHNKTRLKKKVYLTNIINYILISFKFKVLRTLNLVIEIKKRDISDNTLIYFELY